VFPKVNWSWMDIRSSKGVWITGPSIKFTGHSHTPQSKIKYLFVSRTWPTIRNVTTGNIYCVIWRRLLKKKYFGYRISWPEVSNTVPEFTFARPVQEQDLCYMNTALELRCCEWSLGYLVEKNPLTYRPIGEMEGRVRKTNIFWRVALQ